MSREGEPLWAWPGWRHLRFTALLSLAVTGWFALVFGGADYLTERRATRVRLYFDAELGIPFIPASVLGYLSIYPLFGSVPFLLRSRRQVLALAGSMVVVILVGGVGFLLLPAESVFPPPGELGIWTLPVQFAKVVARQHNMLPSLHVALSVLCATVYADRAERAGKVAFGSWAGVIALSALVLHQHYVADVIAGLALGLLGHRWCYQRWAARGP